ncbi:unnamed protein product [Sphagnum balticum]
MSTVRTNTVSRIRTPNRRPLHHPVTVPRRPDIPGVPVPPLTEDRTIRLPLGVPTRYPVTGDGRSGCRSVAFCSSFVGARPPYASFFAF